MLLAGKPREPELNVEKWVQQYSLYQSKVNVKFNIQVEKASQKSRENLNKQSRRSRERADEKGSDYNG